MSQKLIWLLHGKQKLFAANTQTHLSYWPFSILVDLFFWHKASQWKELNLTLFVQKVDNKVFFKKSSYDLVIIMLFVTPLCSFDSENLIVIFFFCMWICLNLRRDILIVLKHCVLCPFQHCYKVQSLVLYPWLLPARHLGTLGSNILTLCSVVDEGLFVSANTIIISKC